MEKQKDVPETAPDTDHLKKKTKSMYIKFSDQKMSPEIRRVGKSFKVKKLPLKDVNDYNKFFS